jgi:hypothetical protein
MGEMRNANTVLVWKPEWKRPFRRPRHKMKIILRWIIYKWNVNGLTWLEFRSTGRFF